MSKLNLDRDKISACRHLAKKITARTAEHTQNLTSESIERASLRLLGIEEAFEGTPVVNKIWEAIPEDQRDKGICYWFGRGLAAQRSNPIAFALRVASGKVKLAELPEASTEDIQKALAPLVKRGMERLQLMAKEKSQNDKKWPSRTRPLKYVNIGTGDIKQDVAQAEAVAQSGADCVALQRSAGQSLMETVPQGETTEGNEGTYLTQANLKTLRLALDKVSEKDGRYVRLAATGSGLCMPEMAVITSFEKVDYVLSDALYGILFRDIQAKRAFVDQGFSRLVLAHAGVIVHTGEGQYLTCAESYRSFPQVVASLFMNEQSSFSSRLQEWQMGFSHAYEIDPEMEDGFLYEIAQAQMIRECFPKAPIRHTPPTRHKTGDIFYSHLMDGLFSMVGAMTHQDIQELGIATEAIHHPLLMDRHWSLKAANYVLKNTRSLGDEIQWSANGKVVRRARSVLEAAYRLLEKIEKSGGLFRAISSGHLANVSRDPDQGLGQEGVLTKSADYINPVWEALKEMKLSEVVIAPASHRRYASYRSEGGGRGGRNDRGRGNRNDRGDSTVRSERLDRSERNDKRNERGNRSERTDRNRSSRSERDNRKTERSSRSSRDKRSQDQRGNRNQRDNSRSRSKETAKTKEAKGVSAEKNITETTAPVNETQAPLTEVAPQKARVAKVSPSKAAAKPKKTELDDDNIGNRIEDEAAPRQSKSKPNVGDDVGSKSGNNLESAE